MEKAKKTNKNKDILGDEWEEIYLGNILEKDREELDAMTKMLEEKRAARKKKSRQ